MHTSNRGTAEPRALPVPSPRRGEGGGGGWGGLGADGESPRPPPPGPLPSRSRIYPTSTTVVPNSATAAFGWRGRAGGAACAKLMRQDVSIARPNAEVKSDEPQSGITEDMVLGGR